ncbi:DUF5615 family PIN-like protein [Flavimarina sp. Hel_I_48]|uniref:DUF5615 family PIN-like protein n=1 Tax=Flavimarina sp. Hel_I_48 TaxID=1392488 RepID=UPI00056A22C1|nr:DUF5615 family PIN-like protein [Flavimarina sp. Hel_I_48]
MKLLLDENIPIKLKRDILNFKAQHEVYTVADQEWKGTKNGELLKLMLNEKFDVLITADKNIGHQQNFENYQLPVIILHTFKLTYAHLKILMSQLEMLLQTELPSGITIIRESQF